MLCKYTQGKYDVEYSDYFNDLLEIVNASNSFCRTSFDRFTKDLYKPMKGIIIS